MTAHARVDVARVRLSAGAEEPGHPATAASVELSVDRPGGWLVGDAVLDGGEPGPRIRRRTQACWSDPVIRARCP